jgi:hypothetical protein
LPTRIIGIGGFETTGTTFTRIGSNTLGIPPDARVDIRVIDTGRSHADEDFVLIRRRYRDVGSLLEFIKPAVTGEQHHVHGFWNVASHAPVSSTG